MKRGPTLITRAAEWATALRWEDIPTETQRLARAQLLGWLGSVAAGWLADEAPGVVRVAARLGATQCVRLWPGGGPLLDPLGAAYAGAALSCANDYDDYLFMAHTGHSACGVPWALGLAGKRPLSEVLAATVAANEVMGRLGAACLFGPQNGQLWTFVHLVGAVVAGARLEGRPADAMARALATAFFQPPMALWTGFGASSAKLLSAATPTLLGLLALAHEAEGVAGAADALEGPGGFFERFSFLPLPEVFDDLGTRWVTDSLSVKPVPGCAYVTAPIAAALECARHFAERHGRPLHPGDVGRVAVAAGALTVGMERLLGPMAARTPLSPVAVNFSVPFSVALALSQGRLTPEDLCAGPLRAHEATLRALAGRVELSLDPRATEAVVRGVAPGLLPALRKRGMTAVLRGLAAALRATPMAAGQARVSLGAAAGSLTRTVAALLSTRGGDQPVVFPFGARVAVTTTSGEELEAAFEVPPGAAGSGHDAVCDAARAKLVRETRRFAPDAPLDDLAERVLSGALDDGPTTAIAEEISPRPERLPHLGAGGSTAQGG